MEALSKGFARGDLNVFYHLARAILVPKESHFDLYDQAFAEFFRGVQEQFDVDDELLSWLSNPILPRTLTPEELAELEAWDLDKLRDEFEKRRDEQKKRHDGGNRWIGTGGTSPFGHGGQNPAGVRVGGPGRQRSAVQVAEDRSFRHLRHDRVLDTRLFGAALRRLRRLAREEGPLELDVDKSVDESARCGGEIELVFEAERQNRMKLLLLMDIGGSMDPYAEICEQLFSAAHQAHHFRAFECHFFHNCVYEHLFTRQTSTGYCRTRDVLKSIDPTWNVMLVGDAWMAPYELTQVGGAISYRQHNARSGLQWLDDIRQRCPKSVWLNPESTQVWHAQSIAMVRKVFPMFPLTLKGLDDAIDTLRGAKRNAPNTQGPRV
jgi:uncharacterized protein